MIIFEDVLLRRFFDNELSENRRRSSSVTAVGLQKKVPSTDTVMFQLVRKFEAARNIEPFGMVRSTQSLKLLK